MEHRQGDASRAFEPGCEPNLISRVMKEHVLYMSLRVIQAGEELTVDYNFSDRSRTTPCSCGAPNCRGTIEKFGRRLRPPP